MNQIQIDDIYISIEKKRIKNMYIRVTPPLGQVKLTAPFGSSDKYIYNFAVSKIDWVKERQLIYASNVPDDFVSGETHYIWGKPYKLNVHEIKDKNHILSQKHCAIWDNGEILLFAPSASSKKQREAILNEFYRKELKAEIPMALEKCQIITGKNASEWTVRNMKTRWGTCNVRTARICFNLQLAKKPISCLEYIAIHEFTHLIEKGHGSKFKAYMSKFCPNWKSLKKTLNEKV